MKIRENGEVEITSTDMCHTPEQFWASKDVDRIIEIVNRKTMLHLTKAELQDHHSAFRAGREVFEQLPLVTRFKEFKRIKALLDRVEEEVVRKDQARKSRFIK